MTTAQLAILLETYYGLSGKLEPLAGEIDLNFKLSLKNKTVFTVKIHPNSRKEHIAFQEALLGWLANRNKELCIPSQVKNKLGHYHTSLQEPGENYVLRLLSWVPGRPWANVNPILTAQRTNLGSHLGKLSALLKGFSHPFAQYKNQWDLAQSLWVKEFTYLFTPKEKKLLHPFIVAFEKNLKSYNQLPKGVVHNDANDYNVMLSNHLIKPAITGIIDYGDACYTQIINDVAIACTYAIMHTHNPLQAALPIVAAYQSQYKLSEKSLAHLYTLIGMRLVVSLTKAAINKNKEPNNEYLLISEIAAWDLVKKWIKTSASLAHFSFRKACNLPAHPQTKIFKKWAATQKISLNKLFPEETKTKVITLDLSVSSLWLEDESRFNNLDYFEFKINELQKKYPNSFIAGGYLEPRPLYTSEDYDLQSNAGPISRCIHLGVDFWLPAQTAVHALFNAKVVMVKNRKGAKEYGGFIVLEHCIKNLTFYTLYGHLDPSSIATHKVGNTLLKDSLIGRLGNAKNNGHWAPHLHFQIILDLLDFRNDFPGVQTYESQGIWADICPDPNHLFKVATLGKSKNKNNQELIDFRKNHLGKSLSLQYETPLQIVRGSGVYLIDQNGQKYLDTVNNVAHLGHEHPKVVAAGQQQMAVLNTNTRYLHENINAAAAALLETLPKELSVVHFVNSGSEANELALRMAYSYNGSQEILASTHGYHGNTNSTIGVSSYKFDGKGGNGAPKNTHLFPMPSAFRGKYSGPQAGHDYAEEVAKLLKDLQKNNLSPAALLIEPIISCGGQVPLAKGFLEKAYALVRAHGGLCISDEVQTGCGRMGSHFWGFELYGVTPDIVTIGKPLGNGHPVAAVVCTQEVAKAFANGMEFFNTFGGNPVSTAIAKATLQIIKEEKLQQNAFKIGSYLMEHLKKLSLKHPIIKDVRGAGLFIGLEFLSNEMEPLPNETTYIANRMKDYGILMSTDGPDHNVIKIKPPMQLNMAHAVRIISSLELILNEDYISSLNNKSKL